MTRRDVTDDVRSPYREASRLDWWTDARDSWFSEILIQSLLSDSLLVGEEQRTTNNSSSILNKGHN
jgi:hypothetical protein